MPSDTVDMLSASLFSPEQEDSLLKALNTGNSSIDLSAWTETLRDASSYIPQPPYVPSPSDQPHSLDTLHSQNPADHDKRKVSTLADNDDLHLSKRQEAIADRRTTAEPTTKRKAQNRAAQRAFRDRKERHVRDLETKIEDLEKASDATHHENGRLRAQVEKLTAELANYRKRVSLMPSSYSRTDYLPNLDTAISFPENLVVPPFLDPSALALADFPEDQKEESDRPTPFVRQQSSKDSSYSSVNRPTSSSRTTPESSSWTESPVHSDSKLAFNGDALTKSASSPSLHSPPKQDLQWMAQQNGGSFDPTLIGDFVAPQQWQTEALPQWPVAAQAPLEWPSTLQIPSWPSKEESLPANTRPDSKVVQMPEKIAAEQNFYWKIERGTTARSSTCQEIWHRMATCGKVQSGEVDIDDLCSQLKAKAHCTGFEKRINEAELDSILGPTQQDSSNVSAISNPD